MPAVVEFERPLKGVTMLCPYYWLLQTRGVEDRVTLPSIHRLFLQGSHRSIGKTIPAAQLTSELLLSM